MTNRREPEDTPYSHVDVRVDVVTDDNATIAIAEVTGQYGDVLRFTGSAKREPGDAFIPAVGRTLAISRALRNMADMLEDNITAYVKEVYGE